MTTFSYLHPDAEVRPKGPGSKGVYAVRSIPADTLVTLWGGIVVDPATVRALPEQHRRFYIQVEEDLFLGPPPGDEEGPDYFNHSCEPNCGMSGQVGLITMREVSAGEELTFDYAMAELGPQEFRCRCGATHCRGSLSENDSLRPELRRRYTGYYSPWIERRIARKDGAA